MARNASQNSNSARRADRWNGGIWLLAAALGVTTVMAVAQTVHEGGQRRYATHVLVHALAGQVGASAGERLQALAFGKLTPPPTAGADRDALHSLAHRERATRACACPDSIAAAEFFRWSARTGSVDTLTIDAPRAVLSPAILADVAKNDAARQRSGSPSAIHLTASRALGDLAVVTLARRDTGGTVADVYGFLIGARTLAAYMLEPLRRSGNAVAFDTSSLGLETTDSLQLFGNVRAESPTAGPGHLGGPLDGVVITVALGPSQLPQALMGPPHTELFHLGLLFLATTAAIGLAARRSRREVMLARARSDFVAGVSHDLRMPLAQILLASETLTAGRARDESERAMLASSILREGRRLIGMVENILVFSQPGPVDEPRRGEPVQVDELFEDVVEAVQLAVDDAGHRIEAVRAPGVAVLGGRRQLCQALVNFVDNALKYGKGGQVIRVSAERRADDRVLLVVRDEGPGVPPSDRDRVFDPYARLERDASSERTGTGLGLAVVRQIAERFGGRAWLEDAPTGGTRAVLELAAAHASAPSPAEDAPHPEPV